MLITRPEPEASQLAERLAGSGMASVVMPAFSFRQSENSIIADPAWNEASRSLAVFTSPRSVEFGLSCASADLLEGAEIAAIGPATASALEAAGYRVSFMPGIHYDSESLLSLDQLASNPGQAILFTASGGRAALARGLDERGWSVRTAHVYERVPRKPRTTEIDAISNATAVLSTWTSGTAMEWLSQRLPGPAWASIKSGEFMVISERLEALALQSGAQKVHLAGGPGNEALFNAILKLARIE